MVCLRLLVLYFIMNNNMADSEDEAIVAAIIKMRREKWQNRKQQTIWVKLLLERSLCIISPRTLKGRGSIVQIISG